MRPGPFPMPMPPPPPPDPLAEPPAPPVPPAPALGAALGTRAGSAVGRARGWATATASGAIVAALRPRLTCTSGCGRVMSGTTALAAPSGVPPGAPPGPRTRKISPSIAASTTASRFQGTRRFGATSRGGPGSVAGRGDRAAISERPSAIRVSWASATSRAVRRAPGTRTRAAARAAPRASPSRIDACKAARRAARRSVSCSLIKVDLQRERRPRVAGHELVVRLGHRACELAILQQLDRQRRDAVALCGALVRAVREHDRGVPPGRLGGELVAYLGGDALLLGVRERGVATQEREAAHLDAHHDRRRIDARRLRGLARRREGVRREEDREHAEEQVGPEPAGEIKGNAAVRGARHGLTPRERIGGALETYGCIAQLLDDTLEIEQLTLALDGALVDAPLLGGHVREDRFRIAGPEVQRAERRHVTQERADLRFLQQRARAHLRVTDLAADMKRERQQDEDADEARVGDRERREVEHDAAVESLLPEQQERTRDELRARGEQLRVGGRRDRQAEPGYGDRREDEHVPNDLEHRPQARMLSGEELGQTARVDGAGVRGGLGRPSLAHRVGEPREHRSQRRFARRRLVGETLECLRGPLSIQPLSLLSPD